MDVDYRDVPLILGSYFGVVCDHAAEMPDGTTVWISVPDQSEFYDTDNEMMSGMNLAKHFKAMLKVADIHNPRNIIVKVKTRNDGCWDSTRAASSLHMMVLTIAIRRLGEGGIR